MVAYSTGADLKFLSVVMKGKGLACVPRKCEAKNKLINK